MQYQFDGERERRAEFAMPKRTKQMGGIEQRLRIFVEDYVYTSLSIWKKRRRSRKAGGSGREIL